MLLNTNDRLDIPASWQRAARKNLLFEHLKDHLPEMSKMVNDYRSTGRMPSLDKLEEVLDAERVQII